MCRQRRHSGPAHRRPGSWQRRIRCRPAWWPPAQGSRRSEAWHLAAREASLRGPAMRLTSPHPGAPRLSGVSTLSELVSRHAELPTHDVEWLHLLVGDWQLISDLAFADLVLWLPTADSGFVAVAQARPSTAATV